MAKYRKTITIRRKIGESIDAISELCDHESDSKTVEKCVELAAYLIKRQAKGAEIVCRDEKGEFTIDPWFSPKDLKKASRDTKDTLSI